MYGKTLQIYSSFNDVAKDYILQAYTPNLDILLSKLPIFVKCKNNMMNLVQQKF